MASNVSASNKLNTSDTVDEFEPNVDFKPVIPLPALVDQKTGEEDETILFEHRAKLLRFDASTKEWKERGLGNIKLLVNKDNNQKLRLLMRREQIMKVCCNHAVTTDMVFQKIPNVDKAVSWCAKDFSEGELIAETFCLRFKSAQVCDEFINAVKSSQSKMKDESKFAKEEQNTPKQTNQTGFADKFKAKAGSWHCDTCYTNNLENFEKCACCESPKPNSTVPAKSVSNTPSNVTITVGWGDKFKPKTGSWECQACFVRNEGTVQSCSACNSPKDPTKAKTAVKQTDGPKFNFGIPPKSANATTAAPAESIATSTGSTEVKPSAVLCNTNKKSIFDTAGTGITQFRFGIPPANDEKQTPETSIFDGTGAHKFSFGIPQNNLGNMQKPQAFGEIMNKVIEASKTANNEPIDFTVKNNDTQNTPAKPALLPTPQTDSAFGSKFGFVFKPKTPTKGKSPINSPQRDRGDESDGNEYVAEDECHHLFTPVVPLPDKVDVVTGEEDESELYGHVGKLYRFLGGEWKERGKGIVKILKHNESGKLRVVMRRDQVLKICLNHSLTPDIRYNRKDDKTWLFAVNDFSEGELSLEHFCLRFKNKEIAIEYREAINKALEGVTGGATKTAVKVDKLDKNESDDVIFVSEIQASNEEKEKAKELMLPENFFTYKNKEPCQGCRGCQNDDDLESTASTIEPATKESKPFIQFTTTTTVLKTPFITATNASTPVKTTAPLFQSPTNSLYGTPTNLEKTVDTSIFRTPLGSIGSNSKVPPPATTQSNFSINATNKENSFIQKSDLFPGFKEKNATNEETQSNNDFGTAANKGLLAPPKLSIVNPSNENQSKPALNNFSFGVTQPESIFTDSKPALVGNVGVSSYKSIFNFSKDMDNQNTEVKSIFDDNNKSENLFTTVNKGSIFGPGALGNTQPEGESGIFGSTAGGMSAFGSIGSQNQVFGNGKSIFGTPNQTTAFGSGAAAAATANTDQAKVEAVKPIDSSDKKPEENKTEKTEGPFSVDNSLTFTDFLSSSSGGFTIQKNPDFKWEGTGQQLFVAKKGGAKHGDGSNNDSGAGEETGAPGTEEEYDPHYEPIVPLPDKIVVTTGEEDEVKIFGERCKLFRYDENCREWKERGVGEMKILYHPDRKAYRFLLRREQVYKAVLNMLLHMDLELLKMKNSDKAWTWAGRNFAENAAGEQETLAVRFKSAALAATFHEKVTECVRKLQAGAATALQEEKDKENNVTPLRLPKHLEESARADHAMSGEVKQRTSVGAALASVPPTTKTETSSEVDSSSLTEVFKQVHFQESEEDHEDHEDHEDQDDEEEEDYDQEYDGYYNEEEEENAAYYSCDGEAIIRQGKNETTCSFAHVQVLFDQEIYSPKILVTDPATGEILADMLIYTDTEFQMSGDTVMWSGKDYTSNDPVDKTVTVNFFDSDTTMQFYDSCETSKAATYSSTDPES